MVASCHQLPRGTELVTFGEQSFSILKTQLNGAPHSFLCKTKITTHEKEFTCYDQLIWCRWNVIGFDEFFRKHKMRFPCIYKTLSRGRLISSLKKQITSNLKLIGCIYKVPFFEHLVSTLPVLLRWEFINWSRAWLNLGRWYLRCNTRFFKLPVPGVVDNSDKKEGKDTA